MVQCELGFHPPYAWDALLAFLADRLIAQVEHLNKGHYLRSLTLESMGKAYVGWVDVSLSPHTPALRVTISSSLSDVIPQVLERVGRLFDVFHNPQDVAPAIQALLPIVGLRVPGAVDGFEVGVRAIVGQQVSIKAARTLVGRIAQRFGDTVNTPDTMVVKTFPNAQILAHCICSDLTATGITAKRAASIIALAQAVANQTIVLSPEAPISQTIAKLRELPGIGEWTAQYIAMRALSWPDAFPHTDLGVKHALGERRPKKILAMAESWRPWRAYATMALWHSLSSDAPKRHNTYRRDTHESSECRDH
ncbi:MAG: hypothetical protein BVN29_05840 [Nitrospira sp. ST-bin5]|nr:MAG: hypothetical protein BVN29_05840 [Nitrospira sp. ST-bin5]